MQIPWQQICLFVIIGMVFSGCSSLPKAAVQVTERFEAATQAYEQGERQFNQGLYDSAAASFESALFQFGALDEREGVVTSLLAMGQSSVAMGDYEKALESYHWVLPLAEDLGDPLLVRDTANHLGNCYLAMDDLVRAEEWSLYASTPKDATEVAAGNYRLKGTIAKRKGDFEQALVLYGKALQIDSALPDSLQIGTNYYLQGSAYSLMGDFIRAEESLLAALEKDRFYEFLPGIASDLLALGLVLERDGREGEALLYYNRAYLAWKGQGNEDRVNELSLKVENIRGEHLVFP